MSKEKPQTKICKHCKTEIPYDAKVCPQCRKKQGGILKWVLIVMLVLGIISSAFGDEDSENVSSSKNKKEETFVDSGSKTEDKKTEDIDGEETNEASKEIGSNNIETKAKSIFIFNLLEKWNKYAGDCVTVSFKVSDSYDYSNHSTVKSKYYDETGSNIKVELKDVANVSGGEWITVTGIVGNELYDGLENAKIDGIGKESKKIYEAGKSKYDKKKKKEAKKREAKFRKEAKDVSYDELMRYPDTYEKKKIKVSVNIVSVEPDGIIFPGDIQGSLEGKEVAIYDGRDVQEPKLEEGDNITIYGYGNGLTTVKVKQKSGLFSKTVDKYSIPGIEVKYMDFE